MTPTMTAPIQATSHRPSADSITAPLFEDDAAPGYADCATPTLTGCAGCWLRGAADHRITVSSTTLRQPHLLDNFVNHTRSITLCRSHRVDHTSTKCATTGGAAKCGPICARQAGKRSDARKFSRCASTESHSTSSTNWEGDSTPRVIRTDRHPGVAATRSRALAYAWRNASSCPGTTSIRATSSTMPGSLTWWRRTPRTGGWLTARHVLREYVPTREGSIPLRRCRQHGSGARGSLPVPARHRRSSHDGGRDLRSIVVPGRPLVWESRGGFGRRPWPA